LSTIDTQDRAVEGADIADKSCDKTISDEQLGNEGAELSLVGSGENKTGRYRNRTCDPLIKSQQIQNNKSNRNKDLSKAQNRAYKPVYKQNSKKQENPPENLPDDLAEIVAVWPELPERIKAAIKTLVQTHSKGV
jgi:hypothetical protein